MNNLAVHFSLHQYCVPLLSIVHCEMQRIFQTINEGIFCNRSSSPTLAFTCSQDLSLFLFCMCIYKSYSKINFIFKYNKYKYSSRINRSNEIETKSQIRNTVCETGRWKATENTACPEGVNLLCRTALYSAARHRPHRLIYNAWI
jgi:hypothetical protein